MSSVGSLHETSRGSTPEQDSEPDTRQRARTASGESSQTVEPSSFSKNLTKSDLAALLSRRDADLEKRDAQLEQQAQMMAALIARLDNSIDASTSSGNNEKVNDPRYFCGGAAELDTFLSHLRQNFRLHPKRWPTGEHKVAYALGLMRTWADHPKKDLRSSRTTNPSDWATELRNSSDACTRDFDLFEETIRRLYGDPDRRADAAARFGTEMKQGHYDPHETVRQYEQRCRALWREAGWQVELPGVEQVLYDLVWSGMHPAVKSRIKALRDDETGRFRNLDELFRRAAAADQVKELQARQTAASTNASGSTTSRQSNDGRSKKRPYRPSISSGQDTSTHNAASTTTNPSPSTTKTPARWKSKQEIDALIKRGVCTRCEKPGHIGTDCPTHSKHIYLGTGSNAQGYVKRQRSFDNRNGDRGTDPAPAKN
jgi:hypothetical protein